MSTKTIQNKTVQSVGLSDNTIWLESLPEDINEGRSSSSTPTISVKIIKGKVHREELDQAIDHVLNKNRELNKRLAE